MGDGEIFARDLSCRQGVAGKTWNNDGDLVGNVGICSGGIFHEIDDAIPIRGGIAIGKVWSEVEGSLSLLQGENLEDGSLVVSGESNDELAQRRKLKGA